MHYPTQKGDPNRSAHDVVLKGRGKIKGDPSSFARTRRCGECISLERGKTLGPPPSYKRRRMRKRNSTAVFILGTLVAASSAFSRARAFLLEFGCPGQPRAAGHPGITWSNECLGIDCSTWGVFRRDGSLEASLKMLKPKKTDPYSNGDRPTSPLYQATSSEELKRSSNNEAEGDKGDGEHQISLGARLAAAASRATKAKAKLQEERKARKVGNGANGANGVKGRRLPSTRGKRTRLSARPARVNGARRFSDRNGISAPSKSEERPSTSSSPPPSKRDHAPASSPVGSLSELTVALDKQLHVNDGQVPDGLVQQARDSMSSLLSYNQMKGDWREHASQSTCNVAIVFGKRLVRDQVTVEYASRIRALASLLKSDPSPFRPELICFCGDVGSGNHVSDADAGYVFFRHMCEAQNIDLNGVSVFIDSQSSDEAEAVQRATEQVRERLDGWLERIPYPPRKNLDAGPAIRKHIDVHFTFISTEYHLCNVNDVHHRSPRHSPLKPIQVLEEESKNSAYYAQIRGARPAFDEYGDGTSSSFSYHRPGMDGHGRVEGDEATNLSCNVDTSWSFQYATYPYIHSRDDVVVFLGKCYLLGEELMPLLVNMKGVIEKTEFFQRDNYLMLSSIRRSLVTHVEDLGRSRNNLRTQLSRYAESKNDGVRSSSPSFGPSLRSDERPIDQVLEEALQSLGRCIELVRPAGLLVSSVPKSDWVKALNALEHSMGEIRAVCDPDRPLRPGEWGKLVDDREIVRRMKVPGFHGNVNLDPDDEDGDQITHEAADDEADEFSFFRQD